MAATTRLLEDGHEAASLFSRLAGTANEIWVATAWASEGSSVSEALWRARSRLTALVVGLAFHHTDPGFLRRFRTYARVQESADGTFHPKIYVFRRGTRFDAIVGSSNLTHGGFGRNVEANVHLAGSTNEQAFVQLTGFIEQLADGADGAGALPLPLPTQDEL